MRSNPLKNQVPHREITARVRRATLISFPGGTKASPQAPDPSAALSRERDNLHRELFEAAQIQRKLSGPRVLRVGEFDCAREVFAARYLSGDFAVFYEAGDQLFATVGDITGKGAPAGMWFTHLVGLIQRYSVAGADPAQIAAEINVHLCSLRPLGPFVTMFISRLNPRSGSMDYCNAGHFPPVVLGGRAPIRKLESGGPLLGALPDSTYELGHQVLHPDDTMVAYSDGVIECRDGRDQEFGLDRLIAAASRLNHERAHMALLMLLGAVQDFGAGSPVCDDMSLMVIRRLSAPQSRP